MTPTGIFKLPTERHLLFLPDSSLFIYGPFGSRTFFSEFIKKWEHTWIVKPNYSLNPQGLFILFLKFQDTDELWSSEAFLCLRFTFCLWMKANIKKKIRDWEFKRRNHFINPCARFSLRYVHLDDILCLRYDATWQAEHTSISFNVSLCRINVSSKISLFTMITRI